MGPLGPPTHRESDALGQCRIATVGAGDVAQVVIHLTGAGVTVRRRSHSSTFNARHSLDFALGKASAMRSNLAGIEPARGNHRRSASWALSLPS